MRLSVAVILFILCSCKSNKQMVSQDIKNIPLDGAGRLDKQGHRGCRGLMPENTIPAMINAIGLNVTTLEMDVVITKDGEVVLSHEPWFNHEISLKPDGSDIKEIDAKDFNIYKMTHAEVRRFDVGMKPHSKFPQQQKMAAYKPLLSELIDSINQTMLYRRRPEPLFNIETKTTAETDNTFHPKPEEFVEKLMKVILSKGIGNRVCIQSFDTRTLKYLHQKYPAIKTALLIEDLDNRSFRKQIADLGFNPSVYSPGASLVNAVLIKNCHDLQIRVIPWTVNDKKQMQDFIAMGVDGIITDYPNLFNEL